MARIVLGVLFVTLLVLQVQLWIGEGSFAEVHRLESKLESIRQANAQQRAENQSQAARIRELESGTAIIERLARSELGLVGTKETFFLTVDNSAGDKNAAPVQTAPTGMTRQVADASPANR